MLSHNFTLQQQNTPHLITIMQYFAPAILALYLAPTVQAWSLMPYFEYSPVTTMLEQQCAMADRMLQRNERMFDQDWPLSKQILNSPRYNLTNNDEGFELCVDVQGFNKENVNVNVKDGHLTIHGEIKKDEDSRHFSSTFSQSFSLDPAIEVDKISATLKDHVLVVKAPKKVKKLEEAKVHKIPIQEKVDDLSEKAEVEM